MVNPQLCRACEGVTDLFEIYNNEDLCISFKLMSCANVQITENDQLPQHICSNCLTILNISFDFKIQCETIDSKLRESLINPLQIETDIKFHDININDVSDLQKQIKTESDSGSVGEENSLRIIKSQKSSKKPKRLQQTEKKISGVVKRKPPKCTKSTTKPKQGHIKHERIQGERIFNCSKCPKAFFSKKLVKQHMNVHIDQDKITWFQCDACPRKYTSQRSLQRHKQFHKDGKKYVCDICGKAFAQNIALRIHRAIHTDERIFQCKQCTRSYRTDIELKSHITNTHDDKTDYLTCELCQRKFKGEIALQRHKLQHIEGILDLAGRIVQKKKNNSLKLSSDIKGICTICGKSFKSNQALKYHKKAHKGEKDYRCNVCLKQFTWPHTYRMHMKIHEDVRNYKCSVCNKAFRQSYHLKRHFMTHTNERPHPCQLCERRFAIPSELRVHMRVHTGERAFSCNVCEQTFADNSGLRKHIQLHTLVH